MDYIEIVTLVLVTSVAIDVYTTYLVYTEFRKVWLHIDLLLKCKSICCHKPNEETDSSVLEIQ